MSFDQEKFNKIVQDIVRETMPMLKGVCVTNEFLESVFNPTKNTETKADSTESAPIVEDKETS